ncbi:MAG: plastocyanin/azurin family copper-binding protein [Halobacteriota archaeon]
MKKYVLLITLALIAAPLVIAGCTSPASPSPSTATSTLASSAPPAANTAAASPSVTASVSPTISPTAATNQQTYSVSIISYAFQPSTLTIPRGATVTWTNNAPIAHTVTSDTGAFGSGTLSPGATYSHQFNQSGNYSYHCSIHPTLMTATITVQ